MFSHLLGNVVLRDLDALCSSELPARYFRYVDDIVLVGDASAVKASLHVLRRELGDLELRLHPEDSPKSVRVSVASWLRGRNDFSDSQSDISWAIFIGSLKRLLLRRPRELEGLSRIFREDGFRIPVLDYAAITQESAYVERLMAWVTRRWASRELASVTPNSLIRDARILRVRYEREFFDLLERARRADGFERKRLVPKLRYRASRLVYLADAPRLYRLAEDASDLVDLRLHVGVMRAVSTGIVDHVIGLGANACQAAAQALRAAGVEASFTGTGRVSTTEDQGIGIFWLNGVPVRAPKDLPKGSEFRRFAEEGVDQALMRSSDPYLRELACLHGLSQQPRHSRQLDTAFDEDQALVMDAVDILQGSMSA